MSEELPVQRVEVSFVGAPPVQQMERASGVSDVETDGSILRCLVSGSFQPFLEALRGHEVISLKSKSASGSLFEGGDTHMKAIVYTQYGSPDVLQFKEVEQPAPRENEVLVKVHAASVNAVDWHLLTADIFLVRLNAGLLKPKRAVLGSDIAGRVEAVGRNAKQFQPGDAVFGNVVGSFAEYVTAPESDLALKPANLSFDEAAAVPLAAITALQGFRDKGHVQPGQKVLINGASGGVGTFAVQIAKYFGAEVTAVCSTRNMDMARTLGADHVVDYTKEDFTQNGQQYDLIVAVNGYHPISAYRRALTPKGRYVMIGGTTIQIFQALLLGPGMSRKQGRQLGALMLKPNPNDLPLLKELLETRKVVPLIDKRYPLSEVPDALGYLGTGHARGKIVITVAGDTN